MKKIPFTETNVKEYLDRCIIHWRERKGEAEEKDDEEKESMAYHYIDAFQSMRTTLFGKFLK